MKKFSGKSSEKGRREKKGLVETEHDPSQKEGAVGTQNLVSLKENVEAKRKLEEAREKGLYEAILANRPHLRDVVLMAALIVPGTGAATVGTQDLAYPKRQPAKQTLLAAHEEYESTEGIAPYPTDDINELLAEPQPLVPEGEEGEMEPMEKDEIEIVEKNIPHVVGHFLNPSLHLYLKDKPKLTDSLKMAIKYPGHLSYKKGENDTIEITKREGSPTAEIPDDLKIVIDKDGKITEINGENLEYDNWDEVVNKIKQYSDELEREKNDPLNFQIPEEHADYEEYIFFHLDKFFFEYLELRGGLTEEEKQHINTEFFEKAKKRSKTHKKGGQAIFVTPTKLANGKIVIDITSDRSEEGFPILLSFSPNGRLLVTENEGETYKKIGPDNLFEEQLKTPIKKPEREDVSEHEEHVSETDEALKREVENLRRAAERGLEVAERARKTKERAQREVASQKPTLMWEVSKNPSIIPGLLKNPDKIMKYVPEGMENFARELIDKLKERMKSPAAKRGVTRLKNDIRKGVFKMPSSITEADEVLTKYFPTVTMAEVFNLAKTYESIYKKRKK